MVSRYLKTPMKTNSFYTIWFLRFSGTSNPLWKPIVFAPFGFYGFQVPQNLMKTYSSFLQYSISVVSRYLKTYMKTNSFCTIWFLQFPGTSKPLWKQMVLHNLVFTVPGTSKPLWEPMVLHHLVFTVSGTSEPLWKPIVFAPFGFCSFQVPQKPYGNQ